MFTSGSFLIYLFVSLLCFYILPGQLRSLVLLVGSCLMIGSLSKTGLVLFLVFSAIAYAGSVLSDLERERGHAGSAARRAIATAWLLAAVLFLYKYGSYSLERLHLLEKADPDVLHLLIIPLGLSFYLFQAIGYLADVGKGKIRAEKNPLRFLLFMAFFPKFVSGPIERGDTFLPQIEALREVKLSDDGRVRRSLCLFLWGYFLKLAVADRLGPVVAPFFESPQAYYGLALFLGMLLYTLQIYADFAGYTYIAAGTALLFGIELSPNFRTPYLASSITDFWRRWHISLSSWLRDYIYIPLGGNRRGTLRKHLNTMIVFLVSGMWHGTGMNFVVWGLLHGLFSVLDSALSSIGLKYRGVISWALTFLSVSVAWVFFRASSLRSAVTYLTHMVQAEPMGADSLAPLKVLGPIECAVIAGLAAAVFLLDGIARAFDSTVPELMAGKNRVFRYVLTFLLILAVFVFGVYGPGYDSTQFIYMQF